MNAIRKEKIVFVVCSTLEKPFFHDLERNLKEAFRGQPEVMLVERDTSSINAMSVTSRNQALKEADGLLNRIRKQIPGTDALLICVAPGAADEVFFHEHLRKQGTNGYCFTGTRQKNNQRQMTAGVTAFAAHLLYLHRLQRQFHHRENAQQTTCMHARIHQCAGWPAVLRLNDICNACLNNQQLLDIPTADLQLLGEVLERQRPYLLNRYQLLHGRKDQYIKVTGNDFTITFSALGERTVPFTPLEKVVYFLFLRHPEGISLDMLPAHQDWMKMMYARIATSRSRLQFNKHIRALCDPTDNSISEKISRIRLKLEAIGGMSFARTFCIKGRRGEVKKITLQQTRLITDRVTALITDKITDHR